MVLRVGLGVVHDGLAHQRAPGHHPPLRQEPGRQARHLIRVVRQDHRDWVVGRNRGRHSPSDFTSALPISCGMPVTSAVPIAHAGIGPPPRKALQLVKLVGNKTTYSQTQG